MALIYALRFALIGLYTVVWGVIGMLVAPFSGEAVVWVARNWVGWIFHTCGLRVESSGLGRVPRDRPVVFMSNHQSVLDIAALVLSLPVSWRFVYKRELVWIPFFGWALGLSDQVRIDRGRRERAVASLRRAAERVRSGLNVIVFPEGTRSLDGALLPFKSGGFHLALEAQVPVVPVTVSGSRELIPKRSLRVHSGTIRIVYGEPISTAGMTVEDRQQLKERVRAAIEAGFDGRPPGARAEPVGEDDGRAA